MNLSGGQRARVALARSVYDASTDVFLLDDPLSAVDAVVGRRLFEHVLGNGPQSLLSGKLRILVTHHTQWLPRADLVVVMDQGRVSFAGSYDQFLVSGVDVATLAGAPEDAAPNASTDEPTLLAKSIVDSGVKSAGIAAKSDTIIDKTARVASFNLE